MHFPSESPGALWMCVCVLKAEAGELGQIETRSGESNKKCESNKCADPHLNSAQEADKVPVSSNIKLHKNNVCNYLPALAGKMITALGRAFCFSVPHRQLKGDGVKVQRNQTECLLS